MDEEMSRQDMVSSIVSLSLVGWRVPIWGLKSRTDTLAKVWQQVLLRSDSWIVQFGTEGTFVSVVLLKWSWGVLELSGRLDDRNRQWLEFKGLRTSGKILKSSHSALACYKRRAQRLICIYRGVEGFRGGEPMNLFSSNTQSGPV